MTHYHTLHSDNTLPQCNDERLLNCSACLTRIPVRQAARMNSNNIHMGAWSAKQPRLVNCNQGCNQAGRLGCLDCHITTFTTSNEDTYAAPLNIKYSCGWHKPAIKPHLCKPALCGCVVQEEQFQQVPDARLIHHTQLIIRLGGRKGVTAVRGERGGASSLESLVVHTHSANCGKCWYIQQQASNKARKHIGTSTVV